MGSHLSSEHLAQLTPLLGSLARLVAGGSALSEREIRTLLLGVDLAANPEAMSELRLWGTLLHDLQQAPDATQRRATVEALLLRGLPEAPVLLAVATVADSGTPPIPPPAGGTTGAPQTPTRLHVSVTNLDFGILQPGQTTTLEFDVQGGPGQVVLENDHVQVAPLQFGAGTTRLRMGIKPLASGLLFTSLKLVTAGETLEVPIMAQWQDGGAVPTQIVLDLPPPPTLSPPPIVAAPHPPMETTNPTPVRQAPPRVVTPPTEPTRRPPQDDPAAYVPPPVQYPTPTPLTPTPNPPVPTPKPSSAWKRIAVVGLGVLLVVVVVGVFAKMRVDAANQAATATAANQAATAVAQAAWVPALVEVPAGPFLMGSSDSDTQADGDEKPQQTVDLPTYWIGKTEVTNTQFRPFVEGDGYTNRAYWDDAGWQWRQANNITQPSCWDDTMWNSDKQPVVCVSWYEAMVYCRWLSAQTGEDFQLPTEAEWEKAARGTDGRIYPWGNTFDGTRLNYCDSSCSYDWKDTAVNDGYAEAAPVGHYPSGASLYGALDMAGNVWEWTRSEYTPYPYDPNDGREDTRNPTQKSFTLRGGSWYNQPILLRASNRSHFTPVSLSPNSGFRVSRHPHV